MFIDQETLNRVNIHTTYKGFSRLDTPEIRARAGVIEIADPVRGNDEIEYTTEMNEPPYVVINPKSAEQLEYQQDNKDLEVAKRHLADTDYLFNVDRHAKLLVDEAERATALGVSREAARATIRAYKVKYPQPF